VARKRKTLPKDFAKLIEAGDLDALTAVFDSCEVDARGGYAKHTALAFPQCPDELARRLVAGGLDVDAADTYGRTPLRERAGCPSHIDVLIELGADVDAPDEHGETALHAAAGSPHRPRTVRTLVEAGAAVAARDGKGRTPLAKALTECHNAYLPQLAEIARVLLDAGAPVPENAAGLVERIGRQFESFRDSFQPDRLEAAETALAELYDLFDVTPVARRAVHDGRSPITATATRWQDQFDELWNLLVPGHGPAATVQGEVIRLAGRLAHEVLDNGSVNWDDDFRAMTDAVTTHLGSATPVTDAGELDTLRRAVRTGTADKTTQYRLSELAVGWVLANPDPVALPDPRYQR
jgi:ankyrin repeat protein